MNIIQEKIYKDLAKRLGRLPHALLLHGPKGVGKLQLAESFAQSLLCESRAGEPHACGRCDACRWLLSGNHPDLRIVEPEALARSLAAEEGREPEEGGRAKRKPSVEIRIEQIRELGEFLQLGTHRAGRKIAIIHPAEAMNESSSNALLKSLEEPPGDALLILVSHRPARLAATIRSRCVQIGVPVPDPAVAVAWLQAQGVASPRDWLAYAGGAPLRAVELASGELGERIGPWRKALEAGNFASLGSLREREEVEALVDVVQRFAFDQTLTRFGQVSRYGATAPRPADIASARDWLAYTRSLCGFRGLARHPLNPRLFTADMLSTIPASGR